MTPTTRYLLDPQTQNVESLLPGIFGRGTNAANFVTTALQPGVDKITFLRQQFNSVTKQFVPLTNNFIDTYITNGVFQQQKLRRVVTDPDIVFSAKDFGVRVSRGVTSQGQKYRAYALHKRFDRTGTSRWIDNSQINGMSGVGPGLIIPGIKITFQDTWKYHLAAGKNTSPVMIMTPDELVDLQHPYQWSSFDSSTNIVIHHSGQTNLSHLTLETRITETNSFLWALLANRDAVYDIQRSTNFTAWETVQTFTNSAGLHTFIETNLVPNAFYRGVKVRDGAGGE